MNAELQFRLPDLEDYPGAEPYCTRCKCPVTRGRDGAGLLAHLPTTGVLGEGHVDRRHPVELGWRSRENAEATS